MVEVIREIYTAIVGGQASLVTLEIQNALEDGVDPQVILNQGMIAAMAEVGRRYETGEFYVPEMLVAARAMQGGMTLLKPHRQHDDLEYLGKVIIGTVMGDIHDIGKNLVAMMLEGAGFEIVDLGVDVSAERFVAAAREHQADLVAMSALLSTTMPYMKTTVEALQVAGLRQQVKVMVGGAPITEAYVEMIGADGFAPDASRAVSVAKSLL
jgi:5-methyltetrahydrofolate--homocysteine methyltransferase